MGKPIPIVNTDPATDLFLLGVTTAAEIDSIDPVNVLEETEPFIRLFPVGLFVGGLGPVAANDAYASRRSGSASRRTPTTRRVWCGAAR